MSTTERYLNTWPCGCQEWTVATVHGDTIEEEVTERFEPCSTFRGLQAEFEKLELANASHVGKEGRADAALLRELGAVARKQEEHHDVMYESQRLDAE